jgi:hypothetical protein
MDFSYVVFFVPALKSEVNMRVETLRLYAEITHGSSNFLSDKVRTSGYIFIVIIRLYIRKAELYISMAGQIDDN